MIEILTGFPGNVVAAACHGHVTREDYKAVLEPAVAATLERHEKIRLYYDIGGDFEDIDPGAVWEDVKIGLGHLSRWERVAVVSDIPWIKRTMQFFGFLMPGEFRFFPTEEAAQARAWIVAE